MYIIRKVEVRISTFRYNCRTKSTDHMKVIKLAGQTECNQLLSLLEQIICKIIKDTEKVNCTQINGVIICI